MTFLALAIMLLVAYQLKHFLADYVFQGEYMLGKFKPGWAFLKPLLAHVAVHGLGTFLIAFAVFALFGVPAPVVFAEAIAIFDMTIHFFMDRLKAGPRYMGRWKPLSATDWRFAKAASQAMPGDMYIGPDGELVNYNFEQVCKAEDDLRGNRLFWIALGFDQMVHHLTHYVCIFAILAITVVAQ